MTCRSRCMCGALDCDSCRPGWRDAERPPKCDLTYRMQAAGYDYHPDDRLWSRRVSARVRTARKAHGRIPAGARYLEVTVRQVDADTGASWHWIDRRSLPSVLA